MGNSPKEEKDTFLYPLNQYQGQFKPENLVFNANLQEFSQKVNYISGLETSGKLSPQDAYHQIQVLWRQLKRNHETLSLRTERENNHDIGT